MLLDIIKPGIESLAKNKTPESFLRFSMAGDCSRKIDYELQQGRGSVDFDSYMRMTMGHIFEDLVIDHVLLPILHDDLYDRQKEVFMDVDGHQVPGHIDGRLRSLRCVLEIKSVSENTFQMIQNEGKPLDQHILQSNAYAMSLGDPFVLILYVNRNTGEMLEYYFETEQELLDQVRRKFSTALGHKEANVLDERPYSDATGAPCFYCSFVQDCYKNFRSEVERAKKLQINSQEVSEHSRAAWEQRTLRLSSEKKEIFHKGELAKIVYQRLGAKEAEILDDKGKLLCQITVGKNNNLLVNLKEMKQ